MAAPPPPPAPPGPPIFTDPPLGSPGSDQTAALFSAITAKKTPKPLENPKPGAGLTSVELWFAKALAEANYANLLTSYFKGNDTHIKILNSWYDNVADAAQKAAIQTEWPGYNPSAPKPAAVEDPSAAKKGSDGTGASKTGPGAAKPPANRPPIGSFGAPRMLNREGQ